jgi:hypothetical protein
MNLKYWKRFTRKRKDERNKKKKKNHYDTDWFKSDEKIFLSNN